MKIYDTNGKLVLDVTVDDNSYRNRAIMGDNTLTLHYSLAEHTEIPVGAYCEFQNERYTLMRPESLKMKHSRYFEYTVIMVAESTKAKMRKFRNTVDGRLRFPLTAKPQEHLQMFVDNMNKRDSGWEIGQCIDGVETLINYDHAYCYEALGQMASEFKTEFEINGKTVSLRKVENNKDNPLPLSYGRGKGFKPNVGRSNYGDNAPIEILYVQGGTDNIDRSKYGTSELLLPKSQQLQYDGQYFEGEKGFSKEASRTYQSDEDGLSIRRSDKPLASFSEDSLDCSDIYPKRIGAVSQVVVVNKDKNFYDIVDDSIPPNLNYEEYLIEGETMTIRFQSGMLAGREFDVKYIHNAKTTNGVEKAAKRFEIIPQEIDGQIMPNDTFTPKTGDSYAVFNCSLPDSYICDNETKSGASWDMFRAAVKYLFDNEDVKFTFTGELDGIWSKKNWENIGGRLKLGGFIRFNDERFQKEGVLVRITGIKDYINSPHSPVLTLSNSTVTSGFSTTIKELQSEEVLVEELHRSALQFTKRRFRDAKETISMLESALLENFSNSINPITIQTMSMLVGDESLQFRFVNSLTNPTQVNDTVEWNNAKKQLIIEASVIQHLTLGIKNISPDHNGQYKMWELPSFESGILTEGDKKYYLYAKCSDSSQSGEFILSEKAIKMESITGFYHLLTGILNSEYDGERSFVPLYGFTEILPGRITTDKIVSADGKTYFDLANSAIGGNIKFLSKGKEKGVSILEDDIKKSQEESKVYTDDTAKKVRQETERAAKQDIAEKLGYDSWDEMVSAASNQQTIIEGGIIRTSLINANALVSQKAFLADLQAIEATIANLTVGKVDTIPSASNNKARIDANGLIMFDNTGKKKVRVDYKTVGVWQNLILSQMVSSKTFYYQKALSYYIDGTNTKIYLGGSDFGFLNLGYFDKGSTIDINTISISCSMYSENPNAYIKLAPPTFDIYLNCNGKVIKNSSANISPVKLYNGVRQVNAYPNWKFTVEEDGVYTIMVYVYRNQGPVIETSPVYISSDNGAAEVNISFNTSFNVSFNRKNTEYTHIGVDGIMQIQGDGMLFSNYKDFVVKRGNNILRIHPLGIQISKDNGETWTLL